MPRQRSPSRDKAKELYINSKGNKPLKDIAEELSIKDTQVRKWKSQDKWDEELKGNVTNRKRNVTNQNKGIEEHSHVELLPEEIETLANEELTEKQRLFCLYYVRWFNATKAYQKAYDCNHTTAMVNGCKTLTNPKVQEHIQVIKDAKIKQSMYTEEDYFQKMIEIAYSDLTDYLSFGQEKVKDKHGNSFNVNCVNLKKSDDVDGTLIQEVKQGKDGVSVKLVSREFALKWLDKNKCYASREMKARVELLEAQKKKLESDNNPTPDRGTQETMDAITGIVGQMKPIGDDDV